MIKQISNIEVPAAATTYSSIALLWEKPEEHERITGYRVYINGRLAAATNADETYYTAENLLPDTEYTFYVTATEGERETEVIGEVTAATNIKGAVRNVMEAPYNAVGDGITKDTDAIQKAIDDSKENDIVLIPRGYTFLTGALDLKSGITLEVNGVLAGSQSPADYESKTENKSKQTGGITATGMVYTEEAQKRLIWTRSEGWEQYSYRSLINIGYLEQGEDYGKKTDYVCSNVKIIGTGTITGATDDTTFDCEPLIDPASLLALEEYRSADMFYDISASESNGIKADFVRNRIRGKLINISNSQDVYIKSVTVSRPPFWTIHMIYSDKVTTNAVIFNTSGHRNGDGWDPDSSSNCTIFGCSFDTGDDCIAIKSGKNPEGNIINRPAKNIRIVGCKSSGGLGLAVGSEMSGGVENVYVRDCVMSNTRYGIELKASSARGGYIKDFHARNCDIDRILIHSVSYNSDGKAADTPPEFKDISFKNIKVLSYNGFYDRLLDTAIELEGFTSESGADDYYIKNVSFDNMIVGGRNNVNQRISLKYCRNISFSNIRQIDGNEPLYEIEDVTFTK